jgi:perosamine synthetase
MKKRQIHIALPKTGEEEWLATRECFETGWLTQGPKVHEFERAFAKRHGARHAIATTSCTTGLHLVLAALGIGPGDEVIVPAFTWVATANVVRYCGATPVFVDIEKETFNLDPALIVDKVTDKTKAIIPVHLFGRPVDMDRVKEAIPEGVHIIEDAACGAGAVYKGRSVGTLGIAGVFSFHPRKSITTGEGGMITTNDDELAEKLIQMRNHGASISEEKRHLGPKPYLLPDFDVLGFNYRMTDLQGAVGLVQLSKLDLFLEERRRFVQMYREAMAECLWLDVPTEPMFGDHSWQAFVCLVDPESAPYSRNEIMEELNQRGIYTRPGTHAVTELGLYSSATPCLEAAFCEANSIALPLHNQMNDEDCAYIVEALLSLASSKVLH